MFSKFIQAVQALDPTLTVGTPLQAPSYSLTSTDSAQTNIAQYTFTVCSLGHINIADCDSSRCAAGITNDQYIRLYSNTNSVEVAENDDATCVQCSIINYDKYSATCESFTLQQGCYGGYSCAGSFTITLTDFDGKYFISSFYKLSLFSHFN